MKPRSQAKPRKRESTWWPGLAWAASLAALSLSLWLVSRAFQQGGEARPKAVAPEERLTAEATPSPSDVQQEPDEVTGEERRRLEELIGRRAGSAGQR